MLKPCRGSYFHVDGEEIIKTKYIMKVETMRSDESSIKISLLASNKVLYLRYMSQNCSFD